MEKETWSFIWKSLNFIILVILLYKVLAGHVKKFFENRRKGINDEIEEAKALKEDVERRYEELSKKLKNVDKEIEDLTELFKKEGLSEKQRIIEDAGKEAEKIRQQAARTIEQEMIKARSKIRKEYTEVIIEMAEDLIRKKLTESDHERLVKEYIEKVVELN